MKRNRIFSMLLAVCLIMTLLPTTAMASQTHFSDMPEDYSTAALETAVANGLLNGSDGKIMPNESLTRAQMAAIIVRAFGATQAAGLSSYSDVSASEWYYDALSKAVQMKALQGDEALLRPEDPVTRQEVFAVMARVLKLAGGTTEDLSGFTDKDSVASWAVRTTAAMVKAGYVSGAQGKLNPTSNITRKDFAVLMNNIIKTYVTTTDVVTSVSAGNVMVNVPGATLKNLTITGNLIIGDGVGDGNVTIDNVKITGAVIVRGGGKNSLYFNSVTIGGALIVNKVGGDIRIVATGTTSVAVAVLESGAILVTKDLVGGGIEKVEIPATIAANQNIVLQGNFNVVENSATNINMSATGQIKNLVLNESATVTGGAIIKKVTTAEGADSVINGTKIAGGQNTAPTQPSSPGGGGAPAPSASVSLLSASVPMEDGTDDPATNIGKYAVSRNSNTVTIGLNQELASFDSADAGQGAAYWVGALITLDKDLKDVAYKTDAEWVLFTQTDIDDAVSCGAVGTKTFVWWFKAENFTADKTMRLKASSAADDTAVTITVKINKLAVSVDNFEIAGLTGATYDGTAQNVTIAAKAGKAVGAVSGIRYGEKALAPVDAGSYAVRFDVAETASYKGATGLDAGSLVITPKTLTSGITPIQEQTYTGSALEPALTVKDGETVLTHAKNYTVSYADNINAGSAGATVTFTGNYTGTATASFTIAPAPVDSRINVPITAPAKGALPQSAVTPGTGWTGAIIWYEQGIAETHTGAFAQEKVYLARIVLTADKNHTFSSAPAVDGTNGLVSDLSVSGAGIGNNLTFVVTYPQTSAKDSSALIFSGISEGALNKTFGENSFTQMATPTGSQGVITYTSSDTSVATVVADTGAVTILKVGTTVIMATLAEDDTYAGTTVSYLLTVARKPLSSGIAPIQKQTYTGSELKPGLIVKDGETVLTHTKDYTVSYADNINAGTAGVTVIFTGNYTGTAEASFTIDKALGSAVSGTPAVSGVPTESAITVTAVTAVGQIVEYAISIDNTIAPRTGWQTELTFTGLTAGTGYYVWVRAKETENYTTGAASVSTEIRTAATSASFTVTFYSNGGSVVAPIAEVAGNSKITKPGEPIKTVDGQNLTFLGWYKDESLTDVWDFDNDIVNGNITLYAKWSGWQAPARADSRFAEGYPKASVVNGEVQLAVKLVGASSENPMEVFMVVNQMNFTFKATTKAVIGGRTGDDGNFVHAEDFPYISIMDEEEHTIHTTRSINMGSGMDVYFVVKSSTETSQSPTTLTFEPAAVAELATSAPNFMVAYTNAGMDTITLYFSGALDLKSCPSTSAFRLSPSGTITGVSIQNIDRFSRVKLAVSGISDISGLNISYMKPGNAALQDMATTPNMVESFEGKIVKSAAVSAGEVHVSYDGRYLSFKTVNAIDWPTGNVYTVACKYGTDAENAIVISMPDGGEPGSSVAWDGSYMEWSIDLKGSTPTLVDNGKFFITLTPNENAANFAGDAETQVITLEGTPKVEEENSVKPSAVYDSGAKTLTLNFVQGHGLDIKQGVGACYFTVTSGGNTYILRGAAYCQDAQYNTFVFDAKNFPFTPDTFSWEGATISYSTAGYETDSSQLSFESSKPYEGFAGVNILVKPVK